MSHPSRKLTEGTLAILYLKPFSFSGLDSLYKGMLPKWVVSYCFSPFGHVLPYIADWFTSTYVNTVNFTHKLSSHLWGQFFRKPTNVSLSICFLLKSINKLVIMAVPSNCAPRFLFFIFKLFLFSWHYGYEFYSVWQKTLGRFLFFFLFFLMHR